MRRWRRALNNGEFRFLFPKQLHFFGQRMVFQVQRYCDAAIAFFAASTTVSGTKPNFFSTSFNGADAPNECMPTIWPFGPTYRSQPRVAAISTETRAVIAGGSTEFLYD